MILIIDTNVAIHLRDGDSAAIKKLAELPVQPVISVLTRVELEGGIYRNKGEAQLLRSRVDLMLDQFAELPFTSNEAAIYGRIVEEIGFSRVKVIDRMIAAQAIAIGATLLTLNPRDFRGIPQLKLEEWRR